MRRAEGLALVGKRVSVWTGASGMYVGELFEVTTDRPWRAKVRIDGVLEPAVCYERDRPWRRGFRVGEEIEVGGGSVEPTDAVGSVDYVALLEAQADRFEAEFRGYEALAASDPAQAAHQGRLNGWKDVAARQVRNAAARARYEALPLEQAVEARIEGEVMVLRMPFEDERVSAAIRGLPSRRHRWRSETRTWEIPLCDVGLFREALSVCDGDTARILLGRIGTCLGSSPAP